MSEVEKVNRDLGRVVDLPTTAAGAPNAVGYNAPYTVNYSMGRGSPGGYTPGILLGTPADWFSPLNPQAPSAPVEVMGRRFDFPSGYNLNLEPRSYKPIRFSDLRALAENYDVLRTVIETRKDQVTRLKWNIKPREDAHGKKLAKPNDPILNEIREFFEMPDGHHFWDTWMRMLLEDLFVIDAPAVFCRRNRSGKLIALDNIDGATFKIIIDDWGRLPDPPIPAYQQTLHGLPALNYTKEDLIYRPRNVRAHEVYGFSPVEQIIMTVNIALRRQVFLLQYYTEGNVPEALIGVPDHWVPSQIEEFQNWWDTVLSGQTGQRRHAKFVPGGVGKTYVNTKEGALTNETDEWLTRVICFAFSVSPTPFIRQVNRATAESQKEQATEEGLAPIQQWIKSFVDFIIRKEWKRSDIEFGWEIPEDVDAEKQGKILTDYVKTGIFSINMALDKLGEDAIEGGDQHLALLPTGWVPIAPTNQFGAAGGAAGVGEVNDDFKQRGNVRDSGSNPPKDITPPPDPKARIPNDPDEKRQSTTEKEAGSGTRVPFGKKAPGILVDVNRPEVARTRALIEKEVLKAFKECSKDVKWQAYSYITNVGKASGLEKGAFDRVDFSALTGMAQRVSSLLSSIAMETVDFILSQFGIDSQDISRTGGIARADAMERGANLLDMTYNEDEFIPEPNADMSIIPTTSDMLQDLIQQGVNGSLTPSQVVTSIDQQVFSAARAEMIANAESSRAVSFGTTAALDYLSAHGIEQWKVWETMGDSLVCADICARNEMDGPIPVNATFSSGDRMTPGHPRCRCSIRIVAHG